MRRRLPRSLKVALTALALVAVAVWFFLPRLVGFGLNRWLQLPGVDQLSVEFSEIGWRQARIATLTLRYRTDDLDTLTLLAHNIDLDYDLSAQRASSIHVDQAKVELTPGTAVSDKPWPQLTLPQLPFDRLQIDELALTLATTTRPFSIRTGLSIQQYPARTVTVLATHKPQQLQISITPAEELRVAAQWRDNTQLLAQAQLLIAATPNQTPMQLSAQGDLLLLERGAAWLGLPSPALQASGNVTINATATVGSFAGQWRQLTANIDAEQVKLIDPAFEVWVSGPLSLSASPNQVSLTASPALQWRVTPTDSALGTLHTAFTEPYTVEWRGDGDDLSEQISSSERLPLRWQSPRWGQWQLLLGPLRALQPFDPAPAVTAELALHGALDQWDQSPLTGKSLTIQGRVALDWQHQLNVRTLAPLRLRAHRLALPALTSWHFSQPDWQWQGEATLQTKPESLQLNEAIGSVSGAQFQAENTAGATLRAGSWQLPLRLQQNIAEGTLKLAQPRYQQTGSQLMADTIQLKIDHFDIAQQHGQFQLDASDVQHSALADWPKPQLHLTANLRNQKLAFTGSLKKQATNLLNFTGQHSLNSERGDATLNWQHALGALDTALQPRPRPLQQLTQLRGQDEGQLQVRWRLANAEPVLTLRGNAKLFDGGLHWDKASASGIAVTADLDEFNFAAQQPLQGRLQLSFPEAQVAAGIAITAGKIDVALNAQSLSVQQFNATLLGANWHTSGQTLPRGPSDTAVPIAVQGLDLAQVLALVDVEGLVGSGTLDGVLPVLHQVDGIAVRDGELHSRNEGTLRYAPATVVADNIGLQALRDFRYQSLRVTLNYLPDGHYQIQLKLAGHNPDFYSGYPIAFTLNINGELPGLFRAAVFSGDFNQHVLQQLQSGELN